MKHYSNAKAKNAALSDMKQCGIKSGIIRDQKKIMSLPKEQIIRFN